MLFLSSAGAAMKMYTYNVLCLSVAKTMIPEGDGMARFQAHHSFECLFTMHYLSYVTHMEVDPKVHFAHWDLNALYFQRLRPHRHPPPPIPLQTEQGKKICPRLQKVKKCMEERVSDVPRSGCTWCGRHFKPH